MQRRRPCLSLHQIPDCVLLPWCLQFRARKLAEKEDALRQAVDEVARAREAYGRSSPRALPMQYPMLSQPASYHPMAISEPEPQVLATAESGVQGTKWALIPDHDVDPWDAVMQQQSHQQPLPVVMLPPASPRGRSMSPRALAGPGYARASSPRALSPRAVVMSPRRATSPRAMPQWMKGLLVPQDTINDKNNQIFF